MKKSHIYILIGIAFAIVGLIIFGFPASDFSTYESIASAKNKLGKPITIIAKYDSSKPIEFDPIKNANYLSFYVIDTLGNSSKVIYHNTKPTDFEKSERLVMKGKMEGDFFDCQTISMKCPSKYKDDKKQLEKSVTITN